MSSPSPIEIVALWQSAVNGQNTARLVEVSDPNIEIVGPRGSGYGHDLLREWLARAGLTIKPTRTFALETIVVVAQHGIWRSPDTGAVLGEADMASVFKVENEVVTQFARYDSLEEAFGKSGLSEADEVKL
jgi:hypothetical protein